MTNYDVVKKLIGAIRPVGETNTDNERFENLKEMCKLMDEIDTAIKEVAWDFRNSKEFSIKRAVEYADNFMKTVGASDE
jgi:hypothetical protein